MKAIILFVLMSITLGSFAQVDSTKLVGNNVERLVDKYSEKIEATIVSLAESLKQPAEFVYGVMVKQQYVKSTLGAVAILALIILLVAVAKSIKLSKWKERRYDIRIDESELFNKHAMLSIIFGVLSIVFLIVVVCSIETMIQGLINPHYGAIQDIVKLFK